MTTDDYKTCANRLKIMIRAEARAGRYAAVKQHLFSTAPSEWVPFDKLRSMLLGKIL